MRHSNTASVLGDDLSGICSRLARTTEVALTSTRPRNNITTWICESHLCVVESSENVHDTRSDVLTALRTADLNAIKITLEKIFCSFFLLLSGSACFFSGFVATTFLLLQMLLLLLRSWEILNVWAIDYLRNWLDGALACAGICLGALTTNRKAAHMAHPTNATDSRETLKISSALTAKITLANILLFSDDRCELVDLFFTEIASAAIRIKARRRNNDLRACRSDAIT